jgi:hypothetical protein
VESGIEEKKRKIRKRRNVAEERDGEGKEANKIYRFLTCKIRKINRRK